MSEKTEKEQVRAGERKWKREGKIEREQGCNK